MVKKYGKWQKGNYWRLNADKMKISFEKASVGVQKPTAIQDIRDKNGKIIKWRQYYKPITPREFWD